MIYEELNGSTLAYVGDAYWSLIVRKYLISKGYTKAKDLQTKSVKFVSAKAQASFIPLFMDDLDDKQQDIFKRGRNFKSSSVPKNTDVQTYRLSTGFEAIIGYLYLNEDWEKLNLIWNKVKAKMEGQ
ncbi:MAG: Mini-ribonuclease 3 [Erysipelotrichaceae bacterium]|nr:Mini-ribonuclease 3 [Erysipelotrichaceae bacterium]MDY5252980.1 ribonuclease III domain-containing protein [Erysipelotrichaceae bacterium]